MNDNYPESRIYRKKTYTDVTIPKDSLYNDSYKTAAKKP